MVSFFFFPKLGYDIPGWLDGFDVDSEKKSNCEIDLLSDQWGTFNFPFSQKQTAYRMYTLLL